MPRKIRQLISDLEKAGFLNRGGKGSHRNFLHAESGAGLTLSGQKGADAKTYQEIATPMKRKTDIYHRWVGWSEEDQTYIGRCPDLFDGGCHGDDPLKVAKELQKAIDEWEAIFSEEARPLPPARVKPTMELV